MDLDSDGFFTISPTLDYSGETDFEIYLDDGDLQSQESNIYNLEISTVNDIPEWSTETLDLLDKNIYEDCESVENINFAQHLINKIVIMKTYVNGLMAIVRAIYKDISQSVKI